MKHRVEYSKTLMIITRDNQTLLYGKIESIIVVIHTKCDLYTDFQLGNLRVCG